MDPENIIYFANTKYSLFKTIESVYEYDKKSISTQYAMYLSLETNNWISIQINGTFRYV